MAEGEWPTEWQPMIDAVGQDFGGGIVYVAADDVEKALVRRYLEPLEFDCPLHYDEEAAKRYGYRGIVAPYSGMSTWVADAKWKPGTVAFTSAERGALPPNAGLGRYLMPGDRVLVRHGAGGRLYSGGHRGRPAESDRLQAALVHSQGNEGGTRRVLHDRG